MAAVPSRDIPNPYIFESRQWLPYPVEIVFAFFAQPENLPRLSPKWQKLRIEEAMFRSPGPPPASPNQVRSFAAGAGTRLTVSFRPFPLSPIRLPWHVRIAEFEWNDHFCDEQEEGPFRSWRHCHHVSAQNYEDQPGTLLRDRVEYALPLEPLSKFANTIVVRPMLQRMFTYRQKRTTDLLALFAPKQP